MTPDEIILFAKIMAYLSGDKTITLTEIDRDAAMEALKRMADQRIDWNQQQKELFKFLVDLCKQSTQ